MSEKNIFCPVCSTGRVLPNLRIPFGKILSYSFFWTLILGSIVYMSWGWEVCLWACPAMGVFIFMVLEVIHAETLKKELTCPVCKFDPVLYKRSPEEAQKKCLEGLKLKEEHFLAKWQQLKKTVFSEG
jgi:hypothetical protein